MTRFIHRGQSRITWIPTRNRRTDHVLDLQDEISALNGFLDQEDDGTIEFYDSPNCAEIRDALVLGKTGYLVHTHPQIEAKTWRVAVVGVKQPLSFDLNTAPRFGVEFKVIP